MAKVKHAKQLSGLPKPYHTAAMAEVTKQTDRGAAIVGTAYVDLVLRDAITARLRDDADLLNQLFENRGPLQDFGARIQVGFALKIYDQHAYDDLRIIKDIRNAYAHSAEAMDFDNAGIVALCAKLWYPRTIRYGRRPMPSTPKEHFVRAVELLTVELHHYGNMLKNGFTPRSLS